MSSEHEIHFDAENFWILFKLKGLITSSMMPGLIQQAIRLSLEHQCIYSLADYTEAEITGTISDLYNVNSHLGDFGLRPNNCVAIVHKSALKQNGWSQFGENVAQNRGFHGIRYFNDLAAAKAWLRSMQAEHKAG